MACIDNSVIATIKDPICDGYRIMKNSSLGLLKVNKLQLNQKSTTGDILFTKSLENKTSPLEELMMILRSIFDTLQMQTKTRIDGMRIHSRGLKQSCMLKNEIFHILKDESQRSVL